MTDDPPPTKVERFVPNPDHGRPRVASFSGPEGKLSVHCAREDGTLWLFADGPRGGARGEAVVPIRRAADMLRWLDQPTALMPTSRGVASLRDGELYLGAPGFTRPWKMRLDPAATDAFKLCLREWATTAQRLHQEGR